VSKLPENVRNRIAGIVVFGDTYEVWDGGKIKKYPKDKFLSICYATDQVCHDPTASFPVIFPAHLQYATDVPKAASFLQSKIKAAQNAAKTA